MTLAECVAFADVANIVSAAAAVAAVLIALRVIVIDGRNRANARLADYYSKFVADPLKAALDALVSGTRVVIADLQAELDRLSGAKAPTEAALLRLARSSVDRFNAAYHDARDGVSLGASVHQKRLTESLHALQDAMTTAFAEKVVDQAEHRNLASTLRRTLLDAVGSVHCAIRDCDPLAPPSKDA